MAKLRAVILLLVEEKSLPPRYKDHPLQGEWKHSAMATSNRIGC